MIPMSTPVQPGEFPLPAALCDATPAINALNSLLRGEVSAIETFTQAIDHCGSEAPSELTAGLRSHEERVAKLRDRIAILGGEPATGSGVWGTFAQLVEGGAALFGRSSALRALAEGEGHGQALYRAQRELADAGSLRLIDEELMPEQSRTHAQIHQLCEMRT